MCKSVYVHVLILKTSSEFTRIIEGNFEHILIYSAPMFFKTNRTSFPRRTAFAFASNAICTRTSLLKCLIQHSQAKQSSEELLKFGCTKRNSYNFWYLFIRIKFIYITNQHQANCSKNHPFIKTKNSCRLFWSAAAPKVVSKVLSSNW